MNYAEFQSLENKIAYIIIPYIRPKSLEPQRRKLQVDVIVTLIHRNAESYSKLHILEELYKSYDLIKKNKENRDVQHIMEQVTINTRQLENAILQAKQDRLKHMESNS